MGDFLRSLSPARRFVWGADVGAICDLRCRCRILLRRLCQRIGQEWIPDQNLTGVDCLKLSQPVDGRLYTWLALTDGFCGRSGYCRATLCPNFHQNWSYRSSCLRIRRRKMVSQIGSGSYRVKLICLLSGALRSQLERTGLLDDLKSRGDVVQGVPGFVTEFLYRLWPFHLWVVVRKGWRVGFGARRLVHSRISF